MAPVCSSCSFQIPLQANRSSLLVFTSASGEYRPILAFEGAKTKFYSKKASNIRDKYRNQWSFIGGSKLDQIGLAKLPLYRKRLVPSASWITSAQLASNVFTLGTVAVLPFYTLMVVAPKADMTKRSMESNIPYVILGILYAYLLYLSWTPDTIRLMFASKYWLPELHGIAKMFSNDMTLASAWIHLLAVDLFAARQVYRDGLQNEIETRHSVSLCLLFCPIGIVTHVLTKVLTRRTADIE